ncbi:MAG: protein nirF [Alphaproteobacteria bacterium]|nr:protein nirF [Alphaproteobacteria bacterium]
MKRRTLFTTGLGGVLAAATAGHAAADVDPMRGTGDLGLVIERAAGRVAVIETTTATRLFAVDGLGDLSHASAVFSRDGRFGYVFGRDGGLSKVDLLRGRLVARIIQGGNSIGGAISQDGRVIAVSNYEPGGVKLFDAADLSLLSEIAAIGADGARSKVVGLVDAPDGKLVFALYDAGEIWTADIDDPRAPVVQRYRDVGRLPYDGMITPDGRHYVAGLFGEDGVALLDLWKPEAGVRRILDGYGRGEEPLPVYKMPHLEGWASVGDLGFVPAVGRHEVLVVSMTEWREVSRIPVHGQPIFAVARPDGRQVWVNFAHPRNDVVQVIDVPTRSVIATLQPGRAVLHLEFTPRGERVWLSVRDADRVDVYDTRRLARVGSLSVDKPSGIFFTARAGRVGY